MSWRINESGDLVNVLLNDQKVSSEPTKDGHEDMVIQLVRQQISDPRSRTFHVEHDLKAESTAQVSTA